MWIKSHFTPIFNNRDYLCIAVLISMACIYKKKKVFAHPCKTWLQGVMRTLSSDIFLRHCIWWTIGLLQSSCNWKQCVHMPAEGKKGMIKWQRTMIRRMQKILWNVQYEGDEKYGKLYGANFICSRWGRWVLTQHTYKSNIPRSLSICLSGLWVHWQDLISLNSFSQDPHSLTPLLISPSKLRRTCLQPCLLDGPWTYVHSSVFCSWLDPSDSSPRPA